MRLILTLLIAFISIFVISITPAFANHNWLHEVGVKDGNLIPSDCTDSLPNPKKTISPDSPTNTQCDLDDAFQVIINFTQLLMAMTGSVMILMFVYGGTMMIVSGAPFSGKGDNRQTINKGKDAIKAAIVGLIIILGAWLAINFTILALTEGEVGGSTGEIFNNPFNQAPTGKE